MKAVHQLIPAAVPGDAVTGQAFAWQTLLEEWGRAGQIVAEHVHPELAERVHRLDGAGEALLGEGNLILHYSVWSKTIDTALSAPGRTALVYHNITPGHLIRDYNPTLAELCDRGRSALVRFRDVFDVVVADSDFNAADLAEAGVAGATVVPLLLDLPSDPRRNDEPSAEPVVLSVGRIVSNKRLEDVIKAFALYQRHRAAGSSLVLIGSDSGFENYRRALERLISEIGVERVIFTGSISPGARDEWYRRADAYLGMSVHEGFCAPLVEALAYDVPVVARGRGAVPETLDGAGLVIDGEDDLVLAAECLHEVTSSAETRATLIDAAERRLVGLRPEAIRPQIRAALRPLLDGS